MDVKVDDVKYRVSVCKDHEDDASPGKIKERIAAKQEEFKKLQEALATFGYNLSAMPASGSLVIPTALLPGTPPPAPMPVMPQPQAPVAPARPIDMSHAPMVEVQPGVRMAVQADNRKVDSSHLQVLAEQGRRLEMQAEFESKSSPRYARPGTGDAPRYASHSIPAQVQLKDGRTVARPDNIATIKQVVRGRAGTPTTVPSEVNSTAGKTIINVVQTDEREMERRWKQEAEISRAEGYVPPSSFEGSAIPRDGYTGECLMCSGTGRARIGGGMCVRCGGTGIKQ